MCKAIVNIEGATDCLLQFVVKYSTHAQRSVVETERSEREGMDKVIRAA